MLHDFDEINDILNSMADEGIVEHLAEPCDCEDAHPLDWADATGLFDEVASLLYPEA